MRARFILLFLSFVVSGISQNYRSDKFFGKEKSPETRSVKSLEAKFTADRTQGVSPLTVKFTDQSTGNPTKWKWYFGDGDSSLVQYPMHIYSKTGAFTVKLIVSDATSSYGLEKKDYIKVNLDILFCDTLNYPLTEPLTYYVIPQKGYLAGNNYYGDRAVCDYFANMQTNSVITGVLLEFSKARQAQGKNEKIPVCIWKPDVKVTGGPGELVFSDTILLSAIVNDVSAKRITSLDFLKPFKFDGPFFLGVMLPDEKTGDTIAFWSTGTDKVTTNTAYIMTSDLKWSSVQTLWTPNGGPPFMISNAIYPKICKLNGFQVNKIVLPFSISPNPSHDVISITGKGTPTENFRYSMIDMNGRVVKYGNLSFNGHQNILDIKGISNGIHLLRLEGTKAIYSTKIIVD